MITQSSIFDLDLPELTNLLVSWGEPEYRANQVWEGLYCHKWVSAAEFTNLPQRLRQKLADYFYSANITGEKLISFSPLQPSKQHKSIDGETIKTLFSLHDGQAIEAVLMRYAQRRTLCISTQAGCAMGCVFCATGQMGYSRNLTSGEIVEQVLYYARQLASQNEQVTNVVVMGMGEPFHNYDATMAAIDRLNHPDGLNLGARRFTISTVGLIPAIHRFAHEHRQINLAISLHAADDELRSSLLPINRKYPLDELFAVCQEYIQLTHRRLSFEWALIQGVNDTPEQANLLVQRLKTLRLDDTVLCHVNVIPLNPTHQYHGHATTHQRALAFKQILEQENIACTIRIRRGIDIQAGCGQLAAESNS